MTGAPRSPQLLWPEQRPGEPFLTIAGSIPAGARAGAAARLGRQSDVLVCERLPQPRCQRRASRSPARPVDIDDVAPRPDRETATVLYTHRSRPLAEIAQPLLKDSINLYGEAVMRLNAAPGALPTNDAALDGLRTRLTAWGIPRGR